jgi:hypothetical protein
MTIKTKLASARARVDKFEALLWANGGDLEQVTDEECAEYDRLIAAERNLYEQRRQELDLPVGTPV